MDLLTANDRPGEYPPSYYTASADPLPPFPPLKGEVRANICVIGAGYTGLSAALHLASRGYVVRVLEASRVGFGASGRNGGHLGSGQRKEQDELERWLGIETARRLWEFGEEAKALVRSLSAEHGFDCELKPGVMHTDLHARHADSARAYVDHLREHYGYSQIEFYDRDQTCDALGSSAYHAATMDWGAGHLHPLKLSLGLARAAVDAGAVIHETSRVTAIEGQGSYKVRAEDGFVSADQVVLACNGYLGRLVPQVAARAMPINNFIVATEPLGEERARALIRDDVAVADSKFVVNYFRMSSDHRLLFGGGESYGYRFPRNLAEKARRPMLEIYPQLKDVRIDYAWGGTLAITMTRMPAFQRMGKGMLSAAGYSGHGVAMATLAGKILAEAMAGQAERFDVMESIPARDFPGGGALRHPLLVLAMLWHVMRDRLGV